MINQQRLPVLLVTALFALTLAACARELARNPSGITNSTSPPGLAN